MAKEAHFNLNRAEPIKVLFIDEQTVVRLGVSRLLATSGEFSIAEVASLADALALLSDRVFDVLILAGAMTANDRLAAVLELNQAAPAIPVLVIDDGLDAVFARQLMKHGAAGYLSKRSEHREFEEALRRLSAGRSYMSDDVARHLATAALSNEVDPLSTLSKREREIFDRLARGEAVGDIARKLKLTSKTVSNHRLAVLKKMGVTTTVELAHLAFRLGTTDGSRSD